MLDRQKLLIQLSQLNQQMFAQSDQALTLAHSIWNRVKDDATLASTIQAQKWSLLVPAWSSILGQTVQIKPQPHPYQILAVDGSQIYYDRHQAVACYLINVGSVFFFDTLGKYTSF